VGVSSFIHWRLPSHCVTLPGPVFAPAAHTGVAIATSGTRTMTTRTSAPIACHPSISRTPESERRRRKSTANWTKYAAPTATITAR